MVINATTFFKSKTRFLEQVLANNSFCKNGGFKKIMKIQAHFDIGMIEQKRKEQGLSYQDLSLLITGNKVKNTYFYLTRRRYLEVANYVKNLCDWFGSNKCITYIILNNNNASLLLSPYRFTLKNRKTYKTNYQGYTYYYYSSVKEEEQ